MTEKVMTVDNKRHYKTDQHCVMYSVE